MTELLIVAGALGGYILYRKWKSAREYTRELEPKIPPTKEELEGVEKFFAEDSALAGYLGIDPCSIYYDDED